ncbi:flagellar basal body-associated protein FliL [Evansella sp. LMS18]|jgi:flagellar FliL protein|uniref:flagellar basal body-associated protein FliL n=1 Tax=Evansella sp. LMS18 TaxID=2924033 RepID=UPI0020D08730|nr:flagellar basal body-associated protein FliL [Evansella sp. LMS18]UTR10859.1 flagellar basal body-associated protein FliL [Evansella sp. LMS18]
MFRNKLVNIMLVILGALTVAGVLIIVIYTQFAEESHAEGEPGIEEILKTTVETDEIITNLLSSNIIRTQFVIQLDNRNAKAELEKRDFQVENIIIRELSDMKESDFQGSEGISALEKQIKDKVNEILQEGTVEEVYLKQRVIQ